MTRLEHDVTARSFCNYPDVNCVVPPTTMDHIFRVIQNAEKQLSVSLNAILRELDEELRTDELQVESFVRDHR